MSVRDPRLFPLFASVETLPKIGKKTAEALRPRGIGRVIDLLSVLPRDGVDRRRSETVLGQNFPTIATVRVRVVSHHPGWRRDAPYKVLVDDTKTRFQLVFFRANVDWLQQQLPVGSERIISGRAELYDNQVQFTHPDYIFPVEQADSLPDFEPIYPTIAGVMPRNLRIAILAGVALIPELEEWIPASVTRDYTWPRWHEAIQSVHAPTGTSELAINSEARDRLAFDEFLAHQLSLKMVRADRKRTAGMAHYVDPKAVKVAIEHLPFDLTNGQAEAVRDILADLCSNTKMNRLLQGDVGAGKTAVAFLAMSAMANAGRQSVLMAPTEILARQHTVELSRWAEKTGLRVACLTSGISKGSRNQILDDLEHGKIDFLIGTHSVFEAAVTFKDLGLAVIDEQHRFGVGQRKRLGEKGSDVDVLIMTATPIPRTLALTHFGDMDVSLLTEKPAGRKPIDTIILSKDRIENVVDRLRAALKQGRQAYWVCPLVSESAAIEKTAAEARFALLKSALGAEEVGLVHGQMHNDQKDKAILHFAEGDTKVLVATTVIEVGVNVPNATIMVIEGAEGFGLSQLHQLRGRVGRSDAPSTCVLIYDPPLNQTAERRLRALRETNDGFKLAELDLELRGAGDVLGVAQSGLPHFKLAHPEAHGHLLRLANDAARLILHENPDLLGSQGKAVRNLLHLMDRDSAEGFLKIG
ncbi:MAG: ATP-dependent DNA helicase RecG [Pseudomonadota bacterium]